MPPFLLEKKRYGLYAVALQSVHPSMAFWIFPLAFPSSNFHKSVPLPASAGTSLQCSVSPCHRHKFLRQTAQRVDHELRDRSVGGRNSQRTRRDFRWRRIWFERMVQRTRETVLQSLKVRTGWLSSVR